MFDIVYNFIATFLTSTDLTDTAILGYNDSLTIILTHVTIILFYVVLVRFVVFVFGFVSELWTFR